MRRLLLLLALALGCSGEDGARGALGPPGEAGPPGPPGEAGPPGPARDAAARDDGGRSPDAGTDPPDADLPDADPPDAGPAACPPWTPPPGLGGPADAVVTVAEAERWRAFRAAREQERLLEAYDPPRVYARYRLEQADIAAGCVPPGLLVDVGRALFLRPFTRDEGHGGAAPGLRRFQQGHAGGPDANACVNCHWKGGFAGAGDRADNAFTFGDADDASAHEVRNPPALWGAGWVELIAREMTAELHAQADALRAAARANGATAEGDLFAKGVYFGRLRAGSDGALDTRGVEGVDEDLVVKPFGWKGTFATLRDFVRSSAFLHLGLQAEEVVAAPGPLTLGDGPADDPDGDEVTRELTEGQITALVAFLATLDAPRLAVPTEGGVEGEPLSGDFDFVDAPEMTERWLAGARHFQGLGCVACHVPFMPVRDPVWRTTAPLSGHEVAIDLAEAGARPRPERGDDGLWLVPVFSDFKRHRMGAHLRGRHPEAGVTEDTWLTRRLWGVANTSPYLHDGSATLFDEAIAMHGGEGSEAQFAADAFHALHEHDRASLRVFLLSLRRGPAIRIR